MIKRILLLTLAASALLAPAQKKNQNVLDIKTSITDDAIIFPESFEQDTQKMLEGWYMKNYTATDENYRQRGDVNVSDAEFTRRLAELPTIIDLPYNQIVRKYIERYTSRGRAQVAAILGLSLYYNPIFEQAIEAAGLPLELKYLPVIESALNPNAVSHSGAAGLWQIMPATAKGLGLEVSSLVDQRRDPYLSSEKAVKYLKDLYDTYNDWSLAIAAYNCGPGTVNKAIRRAGGEPKDHNFWTIYNFLPAETRGYVPMFIAATYVMNYYPQHNISPVLPTKPLVTDTIHLSERVHFNQIASVLNIPVEEIRILNPQYRADIIPGSESNKYSLTLPAQQIQAYLVSEDQILRYQADKYARQTVAEPGMAAGDVDSIVAQEEIAEGQENVADNEEALSYDDMPALGEEQIEPVVTRRESSNPNPSVRKLSPGQSVIHKVQEGESLASIADLYGVTPDDIKQSNNMRRNSVRIGQQLKVEAPATASNSSKKKTPSNQNSEVAQTQQPQAGQQSSGRRSSRSEANSVTPANQQTAQTPNKSTKKSSSQQSEQPTAQSSNKNKKKGNQQSQQTAQTSKKSKKSSQPATHEHVIKQGESLSSIAKKNGVTVDELRAANNIKGDHIREGRTLIVPNKSASSSSKGKKSSSSSSSKGKKKKKK